MLLCTIFQCGAFPGTFLIFSSFLALSPNPPCCAAWAGAVLLLRAVEAAPAQCHPSTPKHCPKGLSHGWLCSHLYPTQPHTTPLMAVASLSKHSVLRGWVWHWVFYVCLTSDFSDSWILPSKGTSHLHQCDLLFIEGLFFPERCPEFN